ncbi:MAG: hypothetical protein ACTHJ7_00935 [Candidatus Nitrosocosmicus sp.]
MKIKSNKTNDLCIFYISFVLILINSTIVLTFSNNYQIVFSQGYIPPPTNNIQSKSIQQCAQIGIIGPTYKGPDGCPRPCPNNTNNPNIITAQVFIPECQQQNIGNQSGGTGISNPITNCPNIAFSGPTYKGPDGCPRPCPNNTNNPNIITAQVFIPECHNQVIGNQSGQTQTNTPSGSCPSGVQTFAACNLGNSQSPSGSCPSGVQTFAACNLGNSQGRANSDDNATNKGNANPASIPHLSTDSEKIK